MKDMVPLGTGNSRTLKSGIDSNMTWEQFRAALISGSLPIDLGAVNPAGVAQVGDPLNKANLLPDDVAAALGLTGNPQPKDALLAVAPWKSLQDFVVPGAFTFTAPDLFHGANYTLGVFIIGGGGSGGLAKYYGTGGNYLAAAGGGSGYTKTLIMDVYPGQQFSGVVGAGGAPQSSTSQDTSINGANGSSSSFNGQTADGGIGGKAYRYYQLAPSVYGINGSNGGQGSDAPYLTNGVLKTPAMGCTTQAGGDMSAPGGRSETLMSLNPFNGKKYLAGGGLAKISGTSTLSISKQDAVVLDDGLLSGAGAASLALEALTAPTPTSPGCGGGGAVSAINASSGNSNRVYSGAGAPGAVMIYARKAGQ